MVFFLLACSKAFLSFLGARLFIDDYYMFFQLLLSRLRLFLSPGYPYEEMLRTFHNQTSITMCSFLPDFTSFNRTRGKLHFHFFD